jgi:hypothetical protein
MAEYERKYIALPKSGPEQLVEELNAPDLRGWRLVSVVKDDYACLAFFERELPVIYQTRSPYGSPPIWPPTSVDRSLTEGGGG